MGRYASLAFLWRIRGRGNGQGITSDIHPHRSKKIIFISRPKPDLNFCPLVTFAQRMRTLSRIALSNFIIPTLFSIAQLVVVYRSVNVLVVNEIVFVNTMLAVFGVAFATVWAGKIGRREAEIELWEDASQTDEDAMEKRPARAFAFPGLGSWRVANAPQTLTFGSTKLEGPGLSALDGIGPENGHGRGTFRFRAPVVCCRFNACLVF